MATGRGGRGAPAGGAARGGGGRGRGRGGQLTFSLESLGFSRGEALPPPTLQPAPLYPCRDFKPVSLRANSVDKYLLTLKQELRSNLRNSKYHVDPPKKRAKVEKYSDKYENMSGSRLNDDLLWDWRLFPVELRPKGSKSVAKKVKKAVEAEGIDKKLEVLVKKEETEDGVNKGSDEEEDGEEKEKGDDDEAIDTGPLEEEVEEETDYAQTYFDNGENYLDESDDNLDEGPTYG